MDDVPFSVRKALQGKDDMPQHTSAVPSVPAHPGLETPVRRRISGKRAPRQKEGRATRPRVAEKDVPGHETPVRRRIRGKRAYQQQEGRATRARVAEEDDPGLSDEDDEV